MKIAVIGSGGREHAIAWKLSQDTQPENIYTLPGNGGTLNNVSINPGDFVGIKNFCLKNKVNLIIVGPETPEGYLIVELVLREGVAEELGRGLGQYDRGGEHALAEIGGDGGFLDGTAGLEL